MAASWMTEETGTLASIWGQANVQNELDAVARVIVSSAREVPFPRGSHSISKDSVGPIHAKVSMQSTAEKSNKRRRGSAIRW